MSNNHQSPYLKHPSLILNLSYWSLYYKLTFGRLILGLDLTFYSNKDFSLYNYFFLLWYCLIFLTTIHFYTSKDLYSEFKLISLIFLYFFLKFIFFMICLFFLYLLLPKSFWKLYWFHNSLKAIFRVIQFTFPILQLFL